MCHTSSHSNDEAVVFEPGRFLPSRLYGQATHCKTDGLILVAEVEKQGLRGEVWHCFEGVSDLKHSEKRNMFRVKSSVSGAAAGSGRRSRVAWHSLRTLDQ